MGDYRSGIFVIDAFTAYDIIWDQTGCYLSDSYTYQRNDQQFYLMQGKTLEEQRQLTVKQHYSKFNKYGERMQVPPGKYTLDYGMWKIPITIHD